MEIGKSAKRHGQEHPRVLRRIDAEPERPTPAKSGRKVEKKFGYSYENCFWWKKDRPWKRFYEWFDTERAASQALSAFARKHREDMDGYRDLRSETR